MKQTFTVELTNAEHLALGYVALDHQDWIDNVVHNRCRIAIEEIVKICVEKCLEENVQIPGSKDAMVELAYEKGWIKAAADVNTESPTTI